MASVRDFPARGKVLSASGGVIVFNPQNTTYELHLAAAGGEYRGAVGRTVEGIIRAKARKIWTVPSGGNFIAPIFGPPKTIQGRAKLVEERLVVIQAGTHIAVEVPEEGFKIELPKGPIGGGALVNAIVFPGATFELLETEGVGVGPDDQGPGVAANTSL
ncbi:MAG TPA: hypothetical protein VIL86_17085 [Tepidisphaeraceae bacterium]|jgi:hypothetical protein